ncbi:metal ABC transporter ATP-binding protein [Staphylococcus carnosus]|uniref:Phosphonate ABC transporter ATP-binding protein n=4 Tax=Staphylococcus carnosus TaxID=1281 RepID=A0AAJ0JNZ7_STACA|nr:metal ABC transporter ATP-binding protein [Staphylococcus carnosus]KKB25146.1 phosphonate ABC transporter ATP-binding protein [Staphylococcus carnosus]POA05902.1 metal ABC transporter ATP-binding protein [Staphylococcus carnosus]QPT05143.1 metal ABC transporter ATP-binding protein [Staphylococcus carnosus]QQS86422.1 metal ABC transporter ATP-binding protein [Staphylococcus carnosus]QRQ06351.1 metal ABC transporter ATP-binding protein [Staphylococcus carnosus]
MLEIKNLNLYLGNKHILQDINLQLPIQGELIGIMGPNGAGKSSLIKTLIGEFKSEGIKRLNGKPVASQLKKITYIPQKTQLDLDFPISVESVVLSGAFKEIGWFRRPTQRIKKRLDDLLEDMELIPLKKRQISELSGGQLQRVLVARALMTESTLYLLDEPFVGIDFTSEQLIMNKLQRLKAQGKLILIVHHDLSKAAEYFDRIILLNRTLRYFGPSQEAMTTERLNETYMNQSTENTMFQHSEKERIKNA